MFHLQNTFIEAIPHSSHGYYAARSSRSQEPQELPEASPPHPPQATSATSPTTTETLTPEELELTRQHGATTRDFSPAKKPRTDQGWEEFLTALTVSQGCRALRLGPWTPTRTSIFTSSQGRLPCPQLHLSRSTSLRP